MLAMTGKNDRTAAMSTFESGLVSPNQALKIGDSAMIGIAFAAIAIGSRSAAAIFQRVAISATKMPAPVPIRNPPTASIRVFSDARPIGNRVSFQKLASAAAIADGAG